MSKAVDQVIKRYKVKWGVMWLAPFAFADSSESRTYHRGRAEMFDNKGDAEARIADVMKIRDTTRDHFKIVRAY